MTNMLNSQFPKILIVGTTPYNPNESSRALDTYFHNWPKSKLRMIYSNGGVPLKWRCESYYHISDFDVAKNFFKNKKCVGTLVHPADSSNVSKAREKKRFKSFVLNILKKRNSFRYYLRKMIWSRKKWLSESLLNWVNEFSPDAIYICFSDDYFILDISYYFAKKFNIPIIVQIGDDYYFKKDSIFKRLYLKSYKRLFDKIMQTPGFGVYISNKIAQKYNSVFDKKGFPIYLSSTIVEKKPSVFYSFNYFGKTDLGRYKSLCILGDALNKIDNRWKINVYSSFTKKRIKNTLEKHHCECFSPISYNKVKEMMNSGSFNVIASGFSKKDIESTRFSLSTKVADSLVSCGPIIAIGPKDDGAIDYLIEQQCAVVLSEKNVAADELKILLSDKNSLLKIISKAKDVYNKKHSIDLNRAKFEAECAKLLIHQDYE